MAVLKKIFVFWVFLIGSLLLLHHPSFAETTISEKSLSSDIVIREVYQPGSGLPLGKIKSVRGEAIVFHRDPAVGYRVWTGMPLYQGDIIRTGETGWISCWLVDRCHIALMSETTLAVLQSTYNSARKTSASFLQLKQGDARFKLMPLPDLSSYEFKVQTDTAFMVTGNADFIVIANSDTTEIIAFDNSRLEVTGMAAPEEVMYLSDFQRTVVQAEMVSKTVETVSREEAETMKAEFHLTPRTDLFVAAPQSTHVNVMDSETPGEENQ
ncbi:MAG: FecR domain-containing protein [Desulfobacterales bacterium]|nr:MAG: FecR domain-containing protein [Desulfobacterales bacterium]